VAGILAVAFSGYYLYKGSKIRGVSASPRVTVRRSVAVLGFNNLSGRPEASWLSTAVAEMLSSELAAGERLRLISGEDVARTTFDLPLSDLSSLSKDTLTSIKRNLGADLVVVGAYTELPQAGEGRIRLDVRLQDTAVGETISTVVATGTERQLFELVSQTGSDLRQKLGLGGISETDVAAARAALPANSEATRLYAEGLLKLRAFEALAARDMLLHAVAADPGHALPHAALAAAWSSLGYDANASKEAKRALDLSGSLSRAQRLSVEGLCRETMHEWDRAIEVYRALYNFFPDDLDYGLRLAGAQISVGKVREALSTVQTLRQLPAPAGEDVRIELVAANAYHDLSEFSPEQAAAVRAMEKGKLQGARLQVARAMQVQGMALEDLGKRN
jgi:TolB-like protein